MASKESILGWLKDAYAMEQGVAKALANHAGDAKDYPDIQATLNEHLESTRRHAELIEGCIERLGDSTSAIKSGIANVTSLVQGVASSLTQDDVVKNCLAGYATENFEIACYISLVTAARTVGDEETAQVCEEILRDEQQMALWLEGQIPIVTQDFLAKQA